MARICILGIKSAGKTVFISVLANRYREIRDGKPYMEFKNVRTNRYVSEIWDKLTRERMWPDSTPPGERLVLQWGLHAPDGQEHFMKVLDAPGQDVAAIFSEAESLSPSQKILAENIKESDCIVFLINLREIIQAESAKAAKDRSDYENPIVIAITKLLARRVRVAILLSQHDRLKNYLREEKNFFCDSEEEGKERTLASETAGTPPAIDVLKRFLPSAYGALKDRLARKDSGVYVDFVSAVADTELVADETSGKMLSRPCENFGSYGLDEAVAWMVNSLSSAHRDRVDEQFARVKESRVRRAVIFFLIAAVCARAAMIAPQMLEDHMKKSAKTEFDLILEEDEAVLKREMSENKKKDDQISAEREKLKGYLDKEYTWRIVDGREYSWRIYGDSDTRFLQKDDVYLKNLSEETWVNAKMEITPNSSSEEPFTLNFGNVAPGEEVMRPYVCNFHEMGGKVSLKIEVRDYKKEKENKERFSAENKKLDERKLALAQDLKQAHARKEDSDSKAERQEAQAIEDAANRAKYVKIAGIVAAALFLFCALVDLATLPFEQARIRRREKKNQDASDFSSIQQREEQL